MGRRTPQEIAADINQKERALEEVSGFTKAGMDPAYVADREAFNGYRHQQIWDLVHDKLDPGALGQTASEWGDRAQHLHDLFETFHQEVQREISSWSGTFATAAHDGISEIGTAAGETHDAALTVQRLMDLNSSAAQTVKAAIPQPPAPYKPNPDPAKEAADSGVALRAYQDKAAAAEAEAQDACTHIYNPTLPASGDSVPRFVPAPAQPSSQPAAPKIPANSTDRDSVPADKAVKNDPKKDDEPGDSKPGDSKPSDNQPGNSKPDNQTTHDGAQSNSGTNQTQAASTHSSATAPSSSLGSSGNTAGTASNAIQNSPSAAASPSAPGLSGGAGPSLGVGSGPGVAERDERPQAPGKSVSGQPLSTNAQTVNTARAASTSAAPTSSSPTSGMPHGGHGNEPKTQSAARTSPEYLRRRSEELSKLPPAKPGVIGPSSEDYDEFPSAEDDDFSAAADDLVAAPSESQPRRPFAVPEAQTRPSSTGPFGPDERSLTRTPPTAANPPAARKDSSVTGKSPLDDDEKPVPSANSGPEMVTGTGPLGDDE
ncbi:WXG100 family type VII secretion target [Nocardia macrotermitis]|uniref:Uncharacterized protein n=1 Tax=Nocardia macrotermitis TaxID=2585198 RepID=A0A7K0CVC1_9NOCA|nr:WXG100 family type VII secretion target [Nocardia macrotermitis]MQY17425.1 hypothetical protein [Nocardia macrotermitis]